jgi:prepilin-type N-terminal cleavage/methylation domain-containing protein/prepilin-type processing-associated H-X9-DG protein
MRKRGKGGFTLIELLVVIAIIAILAAILFPIYAKVRATARLTGCCSNAHQIARAFKWYSSDWGGFMVPATWYAPWGTGVGWTERIFPYVNDINVYKCPETGFIFSYGLNHEIVMQDPYVGTINQYYLLNGSILSVQSPGKCIMIYEWNPIPRRWIEYDITVAESDPTNDGQVDGDVNTPYPNDMRFPGPHQGREPVGFVDGHVKVFSRWDPNAMTFNPGKQL